MEHAQSRSRLAHDFLDARCLPSRLTSASVQPPVAIARLNAPVDEPPLRWGIKELLKDARWNVEIVVHATADVTKPQRTPIVIVARSRNAGGVHLNHWNAMHGAIRPNALPWNKDSRASARLASIWPSALTKSITHRSSWNPVAFLRAGAFLPVRHQKTPHERPPSSNTALSMTKSASLGGRLRL